MNKLCKKCGICCKTFNKKAVIIFPCDIEPIANHLNLLPSDFLYKYCESDTIQYRHGEVEIYFLKKTRYECIFLEDNLCTIYSDRPIQCKKAPYQFFSYIQYWKHMPCLEDFEEFEGKSIEADKELVKSLLSIGYNQFK